MTTPLLLTDEQMRHFIAHGYLILKTDFSPEFHTSMSENIRTVMTKEGNPGNNILPRVPEVQEVFKHPVIQGALTSVLGPDYIMHPHRHCHFTEPGRKVQSWHKDSYWGHAKVRNHHQWWAMIFYYDHAVDEELGPSGIMPGTQYYNNRAGDESEQDIHLLGEAGTFALIHYDLWHRGTANHSLDRTRSMLKFQFVRMSRPQAPTWAHDGRAWQPVNGDGPPNHHETIWQHQWQWLGGQSKHNGNHGAIGKLVDALDSGDKRVRLQAADELGVLGAAASDAIPALAKALADAYEPVALNAAYALASMGATAAPALLDALASGDKDTTRNAAYGLSALGAPAVSGLIDRLSHTDEQTRGYAAFALGEIGLQGHTAATDAVTGLAQLANDESEWVRRNMVEALGTLDIQEQSAPQDAAVTTLAHALRDSDDQVRFTSALSLTRLGAAAAAAVPALQGALHDENRYVRANAVDALNRIGTPDAQRVLIDYLLGSRWCPSTTPESTF